MVGTPHVSAENDAGWLLARAGRHGEVEPVQDGPAPRAWTSDGNAVQPLVDGKDYFRRLLAELRDCHEGDQVYVAAWRADPAQHLDGPGTAVGRELARAASAGVRVSGLVWSSRLSWVQEHARSNRDFVRMLRDHGAAVMLDQRVRVGGSHHQKFLVIRRPRRPETDVAFVGGLDLGYSRRDDAAHHGDTRTPRGMAAVYGNTPAWHDAQLEIHGPAVADVERCFRERWADPTAPRHVPWSWLRDRLRRTPDPPPALPTPPACGPHTVQVLRTYPDKAVSFPFAPTGDRSVARGYARAVARARRLIYVEDQFLWSPVVAQVFADALRRRPELRMVAVVPRHPDTDGSVHVRGSAVAQRQALEVLYAAGGDRVQVYDLENAEGLPVYVHAKVCVVDDVWAAVGSANLNRRSWTHDSELTAAVLDPTPDERGTARPGAESARRFARRLRLRLWREHLDRADGDDDDLVDPEEGAGALRDAAAALDGWHAAGCPGARPAGRLRRHPTPTVEGTARWWAPLAARAVLDPDGRPFAAWARRRW